MLNLLKPHPKQHLTADDIEVRIWGFVVITVTLILCFIVVAMLYSVTFVVQPIKSMAPIDMAYTKMLNDIVLLIVGGIGGVMSKRATGAIAKAIAPTPAPPAPAPAAAGDAPPKPPAHPAASDWNWMGFQNAALDESWVPPPPPTTPADYIPPEVEEIAHERAAARSES
jgi:hypothetical protein